MYRWYAIQSQTVTKEDLLAELKKAGYDVKSKIISNILIFEFKQDALKLEEDNSLLQGYILLKINDKKLREMMTIVKKSRIGTFFNLGKTGLPYDIPEDQIKAFKDSVSSKKSVIKLGDKVKILEGILNGFIGKVLRKRGLMAQVSVELPNRTVKRWVAIPHISKDLRE